MKTFARHLPHYFALIGILVASFVGLILFSYDQRFQTAISVALGASYIAWGVVHHYLHSDLHIETVIEYIAVSVLGVSLLLSLILR